MNKRQIIITLFYTSFYLLAPSSVIAEPNSTIQSDTVKSRIYLDTAQKHLDRVMQDSALWLDSLASKENIQLDSNDASAFGYLQLLWRPHRGDLDDLAVKFKVNLHLPHWDERYAIIIDNDSEDELRLDYESQPNDRYQTDDDINIALQYFKEFKSGRRLKYRIGVSRGELYTRAETSFLLKKKQYSLHLSPRIDYFSKSGWGPGIKGSVNYDLSESALSLSASFQKVENEGRVRTKVGIYNIKNLDEDGLIVLGLEYNRDNKNLEQYSTANDSYLASLRYRNSLYKHWLHYEVEPYVSFKQEFNYRDEFGFNLSLIGYYGNYK
jgi:hypothetical protein